MLKKGKRGLFIILEGIDGSGTTTALNLVKEQLPEIVATAEPTDSTIGRLIRRFLRGEETGLDSSCLCGLFCADRQQHFQTVIIPAINEGKTVVCDRSVHSTWVYQQDSFPELNKYDFWDMIIKFINPVYCPDMVFFFNVEPKVAMERKKKQTIDAGTSLEFFEKLPLMVEYHKRYIELSQGTKDFDYLMRKEKLILLNSQDNPKEAIASFIVETIKEQTNGKL